MLDYVALPLVATCQLDRKEAQRRASVALSRFDALAYAELQCSQLPASELGIGVLITTSELDLGAQADRFWDLDEGRLCPIGHEPVLPG